MQDFIALNKKNTCAVIVTYYPDSFFNERLVNIKKQFSLVVIVDNTSSHISDSQLEELPENVTLIKNNTNLGIATALNLGIEKGLELGCFWFVTFDQDSNVEDCFLDSLGIISSELNSPSVIIGSNYWNLNKEGLAYNCRIENQNYVERKTVISSGMCFSRELIGDIGFFEDNYFIDSVDHEFCLRARKQNYKVYLSCKPLMKHSIGEVKTSDGWLNNMVFTHSADRVYYMARNTLLTVYKYFRTEPMWAMCQIIRLTVEFVAITLDKENRKRKVSAFSKGLKDCVLGRMGQLKK